MKKILVFIFLCINLYAHPHFFMDVNLHIQNKSINHLWSFDKMNSRILIFEFDKNRNKILEEDEQKEFLNTHFNKLKKDNYNIFIESLGEEQEIIPKDITVFIKDKRLYLEFITNIALKKESVFCTADATLYMAFKLLDVKSELNLDIQKSKHDFCIGVL